MESAENEMRAWCEAEEHTKNHKETKRKLKDVGWTSVLIKVPVCPECGTPMSHELDPQSRTLWEWVCTNCQHTI